MAPVILHPEDYELWIGADARTPDLVNEVLLAYPSEEMVGYLVGAGVNSPRNQGAELIEQVHVNSV